MKKTISYTWKVSLGMNSKGKNHGEAKIGTLDQGLK